MEASNDNDKDAWQTLSLATRRMLAKISEEQEKQGSEEGRPEQTDEEQRANEARYIEQRMRDIERFERMVRGYYRPRRKRN